MKINKARPEAYVWFSWVAYAVDTGEAEISVQLCERPTVLYGEPKVLKTFILDRDQRYMWNNMRTSLLIQMWRDLA